MQPEKVYKIKEVIQKTESEEQKKDNRHIQQIKDQLKLQRTHKLLQQRAKSGIPSQGFQEETPIDKELAVQGSNLQKLNKTNKMDDPENISLYCQSA